MRADLLTPLVKAYGTDIGCEVASLGVQVHGGMGYIEETGAAQHFRDIRIAPIYEGTNGIQAADLVGRKMGLEGGAVLDRLLREIGVVAEGPLAALTADCFRVADHLAAASADDRLAGSYPFLTMLGTAVCGWLMQRQAKALDGEAPDFAAMKRAGGRLLSQSGGAGSAGFGCAGHGRGGSALFRLRRGLGERLSVRPSPAWYPSGPPTDKFAAQGPPGTRPSGRLASPPCGRPARIWTTARPRPGPNRRRG